MSNSSVSPTGFGIFDFMTRVIPGAILVGSFIAVIVPKAIVGAVSGTELILFTIASYITGEIANMVKLFFYSVPRSFTRLIYEQSAGQTRQSLIDRWYENIPIMSARKSNLQTQTQFGFWESISDRYKIEDYVRPEDIYHILLNHLEPKFSQRTKRLQTLHHLVTNLAITGPVSIGLAIYSLFVLRDSSNFFGSILVIITVFVILFLIALYFGMVERLYVDHLLVEYQSLKSHEQTPHRENQ